MPEISITDNLGTPVDLKLDPTVPSSLMNFAKGQVLHLLVAPDFLAMQGKPLPQAAPKPVRFQAKIANAFPLGIKEADVTLTPKVDAVLRANATAGADLFDDDPFHVPAEIAPGMAYVGLALTGLLDGNASATEGSVTFGIDAAGSLAIEYLKAFAIDGAPPFGEAVGQMLAGYTIPASVKDLALLQAGDVCTVAGQGSLQVSGSFDVSAPVNPLASVKLPLNAGTLDVKSGVMAGVSAAFTLSGSYQIRVRRLAAGTIELSYLRARGTKFDVALNAAASASVNFQGKDLAAALLGAICKNPAAPELMQGLEPEEAASFNAAVKAGVQRSLQASIDAALSVSTDRQAAFQYEIDLNALDEASTAAVNRALHGDLTGMTGAGVKMLDSLLTRARTMGATLKINLLGIVNVISLAKLMSNCEILFEPASGDLTIKETAQSERIAAITDQVHRQEALRRALFESVLVTT
ncbi:MAG: hypothetical protein JWP63_107, partial [Candidatus Solibacter sp.]|nr:hypothetical protein [Candidatus Solibacter sp.]